MSDDLAENQLAAFIDRILRLKTEADDIASDIKEIYQEAHANGFNKTRLGDVVTYLRKVEKDPKGEAEKAALRDLYLEGYYRAKNQPHAYARARGGNSEPAHSPETGEITEPQSAPQTVQTGAAQELLVTLPVESEAVAISTPIQPETANQSEPDDAAVTAGDVLREPAAAEQGQNIREGDAPRETDHLGGDASRSDTDIHERASTNDKASSEAGPQAEAPLAGTGSEMLAYREARIEGQGASVALPTYADPGTVVMEHTPPVGIVAHPYIIAWPLRELTLADGEEIRDPIVKVDHFIVDGRQRYFAARAKGIEYPVVQYAGDDLLLDVIRLNLASRTMSEAALRMVAQKLAKLAPTRADEIMALMGLAEEVAA